MLAKKLFLQKFHYLRVVKNMPLKVMDRHIIDPRIFYSSDQSRKKVAIDKGGNVRSGSERDDNDGSSSNPIDETNVIDKEGKKRKNFSEFINMRENKEKGYFPNMVLKILSDKNGEEEKKRLINEYKECISKYFEVENKINLNQKKKKKNELQFGDIFASLYLCYVEKIYDLNFLTNLSNSFDILYKFEKNVNDRHQSSKQDHIINKDNINYFSMIFYYFSFLNIKNDILYINIRNYIINNEVEPIIIYKYLESLCFIKSLYDHNKTYEHISPIVEIIMEEFYNFNNYFLLNILHFLHTLNFIDKNVFSFLSKKLNKNIYRQNANYYDLCMLSRAYALYKNYNITFNKYLCNDIIANITKYEDRFQNEDTTIGENITSSKQTINDNSEQTNNSKDMIKKNISTDNNNETNVYIDEIKNIDRTNYFMFKNSLYNDGINFYSFFVNSKTENREKYKKETIMDISFTPSNKSDNNFENPKVSDNYTWNDLFNDDVEHKNKNINNEPFINIKNEDMNDDKIVSMHNEYLRENILYELSHTELVNIFKKMNEIFNKDTIKIDNTNISEDIDIYTNNCDENKIMEYKKKLLFIDNYYIGHIFYIVDSLLSLNVHHTNKKDFINLENKVFNLIKNNENYIITNFDSNEIKSVLIFLSQTNKIYKESFIYCLTHRIADLYINNLCTAKTLAIYLHHLLHFTKHKISKKNRFNHTIRNVIYNTYPWLNSNKSAHNVQTTNSINSEITNIYNNIKVKNYSLLQLLSIYICKNVYFMSLSTLTSILRSFSYLSFNDVNFYNVFIPLFMKHMDNLTNVDILNITQAYNKRKIQNKYFYYLLSKVYQNKSTEKIKNLDPPIKLIG
ncbi:conserved Plasmodium protein, unknown function [Plasmodium vinckei]|uniref:Uncharacterized protein n=1 Tax=Plasmodium vinckei TaxID=5860 RepID=A0A6V7SLM8_PLAVN|nr:conserved Plasmodium protein, unknown function [Plasmodium vinckei]